MEGLHASLRASQVPAFRVMEVMKAAHERERVGGKVLHMAGRRHATNEGKQLRYRITPRTVLSGDDAR